MVGGIEKERKGGSVEKGEKKKDDGCRMRRGWNKKAKERMMGKLLKEFGGRAG